MAYTEKKLWEDKSRILYSPYYSAMSDKQQATREYTEREFLE